MVCVILFLGIDRYKKFKEKTVLIVGDTLGLPLAVVVHKISLYDSNGSPLVLEKMEDKYSLFTNISSYGGYHITLGD